MAKRGRKTFEVETIREIANSMLRHESLYGTDDEPMFRAGVQALLEKILMESKNYHGFRYLDKGELPHGSTPGIRWSESGDYSEQFADTDHTRVYYF